MADEQQRGGTSGYVLGMAPVEIERLARQHEIWRSETERTWDDAGIKEGDTILDLGCGPGFTSVDLLARVGTTGRVVAADRSPEATVLLRDRVARENLTQIEVITSDALTLDYAAIDPDVVVVRWLFSFIPDPDALIATIATALKPGARIAIIDYWHYHAIHIEPLGPHFKEIFRKVHASYADSGGSLDVGGQVPQLFAKHGITVSSIRSIGGATTTGTPYWEWITEFQKLYLPSLVEKGYLDQQTVSEHLAWWEEIGRGEGVILNLPPMVGVVGEA